MTNKQIFIKAIKKAIENGGGVITAPDKLPKRFFVDGKYYPFIFDHCFAEMFWKDEKCNCLKCPDGSILHKDRCRIRDWQYHLQQMVLEEEPLKYIEKFL